MRVHKKVGVRENRKKNLDSGFRRNDKNGERCAKEFLGQHISPAYVVIPCVLSSSLALQTRFPIGQRLLKRAKPWLL